MGSFVVSKTITCIFCYFPMKHICNGSCLYTTHNNFTIPYNSSTSLGITVVFPPSFSRLVTLTLITSAGKDPKT
jgi:hypothetical protein